jgi:hypothetical protein
MISASTGKITLGLPTETEHPHVLKINDTIRPVLKLVISAHDKNLFTNHSQLMKEAELLEGFFENYNELDPNNPDPEMIPLLIELGQAVEELPLKDRSTSIKKFLESTPPPKPLMPVAEFAALFDNAPESCKQRVATGKDAFLQTLQQAHALIYLSRYDEVVTKTQSLLAKPQKAVVDEQKTPENSAPVCRR